MSVAHTFALQAVTCQTANNFSFHCEKIEDNDKELEAFFLLLLLLLLLLLFLFLFFWLLLFLFLCLFPSLLFLSGMVGMCCGLGSMVTEGVFFFSSLR